MSPAGRKTLPNTTTTGNAIRNAATLAVIVKAFHSVRRHKTRITYCMTGGSPPPLRAAQSRYLDDHCYGKGLKGKKFIVAMGAP